MQDRRMRIVAAWTGLLLVAAGGCARSEYNRQRPSWATKSPTAHHQELAVETASLPQYPTDGRAVAGTHQRQGAKPVATDAAGLPCTQPPSQAIAAYRPQASQPSYPTPLQAGPAMPRRLPPANEQPRPEHAGPAQAGPAQAGPVQAGPVQAGQIPVALTNSDRLPLPRGGEIDDEQFDPELDAAFQRLHQASAMMPRPHPSATNRTVPPPVARVASPFAKPGQQSSGSVRSTAR